MVLKLNLIVAVCDNMGIGKNGKLPWKLKSEMAYFTRMTTDTKDLYKKNVVVMGRKTWITIPDKFRPLPNRVNMVLSRNPDFVVPDENVIVRNSLNSAIDTLSQPEYLDQIENIWVIGGSHIYQEAMKSKYFYRLYLTEIRANYECDTFLPPLSDNLRLINDPSVPEGIQEENGTQFIYRVYENTKFDKDI